QEGVVQQEGVEDVRLDKALNLTAMGSATASEWAPVARPVRQPSLQVVQEGVVEQEGVEDVRLDKALKPTAAGWVTASVWAPVVT
ncbi:hypothetical protein PR003_g34779, partial [Phytophthora rubi]